MVECLNNDVCYILTRKMRNIDINLDSKQQKKKTSKPSYKLDFLTLLEKKRCK